MAQALSFAFTATPVPTATTYLFECTRQMSAGRSYAPRSEYKFVGLVAAAGASPYNALTAYTAKFGALVTGKRIFYRVQAIKTDTFNRSAWLYGSIVVS